MDSKYIPKSEVPTVCDFSDVYFLLVRCGAPHQTSGVYTHIPLALNSGSPHTSTIVQSLDLPITSAKPASTLKNILQNPAIECGKDGILHPVEKDDFPHCVTWMHEAN